MKLSQFNFKLPQEKIAKYPAPHRDECRMMVLHRSTGDIEHKMFKNVLGSFDEHDLFVFNDTKVFPARLYGNKEKTGARIEVFLLRELNRELRLWDVLVDPARKIRIGNKLYFGEDNSILAEASTPGTPEYNQALSERRLKRVVKVLLKEGFAPSDLYLQTAIGARNGKATFEGRRVTIQVKK